jgi:uncharacterized protein (DUF302 family)
MTYHFSKIVDMPFDAAVTATTAALKNHGFGVLTQIDVKDTLQKKIGAEFRPYLILRACNPKLAYQALSLEDKIGTMLPCNVVVQQRDGGKVEISAVVQVRVKKRRPSDRPVTRWTEHQNPRARRCVGQSRGVDAFARTSRRSHLCKTAA